MGCDPAAFLTQKLWIQIIRHENFSMISLGQNTESGVIIYANNYKCISHDGFFFSAFRVVDANDRSTAAFVGTLYFSTSPFNKAKQGGRDGLAPSEN